MVLYRPGAEISGLLLTAKRRGFPFTSPNSKSKSSSNFWINSFKSPTSFWLSSLSKFNPAQYGTLIPTSFIWAKRFALLPWTWRSIRFWLSPSTSISWSGRLDFVLCWSAICFFIMMLMISACMSKLGTISRYRSNCLNHMESLREFEDDIGTPSCSNWVTISCTIRNGLVSSRSKAAWTTFRNLPLIGKEVSIDDSNVLKLVSNFSVFPIFIANNISSNAWCSSSERIKDCALSKYPSFIFPLEKSRVVQLAGLAS